MPDYKQMYLKLFRVVTKVIDMLMEVQQECEEMYLVEDEPKLIVLPPDKED